MSGERCFLVKDGVIFVVNVTGFSKLPIKLSERFWMMCSIEIVKPTREEKKLFQDYVQEWSEGLFE